MIARPTDSDDEHLGIIDVYHSIVGYGPFAGEPAVFINFEGCNLQCKFCDSEFEGSALHYEVSALVSLVERERGRTGPCGLVVFTGGEPMRQGIGPLVVALNGAGWRVQVETAGTLWRNGWASLFQRRVRVVEPVSITDNTILCSPKTQRLAQGIHLYIHALVYIVQHGQMCIRDGFPVTSTQMSGPDEIRPLRPAHIVGPPIHPTQIYMLPCTTGDKITDSKNLVAATTICQRKGYRLAMRMNKLARLP